MSIFNTGWVLFLTPVLPTHPRCNTPGRNKIYWETDAVPQVAKTKDLGVKEKPQSGRLSICISAGEKHGDLLRASKPENLCCKMGERGKRHQKVKKTKKKKTTAATHLMTA